jgi:hypothetical protein
MTPLQLWERGETPDMRDCVLSFVAAITPLAVAAPVVSPLASPLRAAPSPPAVSFETPEFIPTRADALPPFTSDAAPHRSVVLSDDLDASRTVAFWTTIDLAMLALRDRVESSPLLRDGLADASAHGLVPTEILALRN